jgi:homoserine/homoserine lactone efflux protein
MSGETWLLFALTETALCAVPGPAVLLVFSMGLSQGASAGIRAGLGVLLANSLYFLFSATSLGVVVVTSQTLFLGIKWAGAVYLLWLGLNMLNSRADLRRHPTGPLASGRSNAFLHGFVTQAANPKALVFFTALLPQFVDPGEPLFQISILAATSVSLEFTILTVYARLADRVGGMVGQERFGTVINRVGGAALITAGLGLVSQG